MALAEVAEYHAAERPREEADAEGGERKQQAGIGLELRKEKIAEHQRRSGAINEKVVPLQRRAYRRSHHHPAVRCIHCSPLYRFPALGRVLVIAALPPSMRRARSRIQESRFPAFVRRVTDRDRSSPDDDRGGGRQANGTCSRLA